MINKRLITIEPNTEFRWNKGLCIQAIETSYFLIPGGIFQEGVPINSIIQVSDKEANIIVHKTNNSNKNVYPDMTIILKPCESLKINRNCFPIHIEYIK
jgi:hypothetical protein